MKKAEIHKEYVTIKCPAGHYHNIRIKFNAQCPDRCVWNFNASETSPTFIPSINETAGDQVEGWEKVYQGTPEYFEEWKRNMRDCGYRCHFIVTEGRITFAAIVLIR